MKEISHRRKEPTGIQLTLARGQEQFHSDDYPERICGSTWVDKPYSVWQVLHVHLLSYVHHYSCWVFICD